MRILLIEDFEPLAAATAKGLRGKGYTVDCESEGEGGLTRALTGDYDAILLDLMLPGVDGWQILQTIRERRVRTPVLVLTARDTVDDRVRGLDEGADDYLVKPFAMDELFARVRALVRRNYQKDPVIKVGHIAIDTNRQTVEIDGEQLELPAREYALLEYLAHRAGEVVTRVDIHNHLYGGTGSVTSNVVDVYIGYLRKRIERVGEPPLLHTRRGVGYTLGPGH